MLDKTGQLISVHIKLYIFVGWRAQGLHVQETVTIWKLGSALGGTFYTAPKKSVFKMVQSSLVSINQLKFYLKLSFKFWAKVNEIQMSRDSNAHLSNGYCTLVVNARGRFLKETTVSPSPIVQLLTTNDLYAVHRSLRKSWMKKSWKKSSTFALEIHAKKLSIWRQILFCSNEKSTPDVHWPLFSVPRIFWIEIFKVFKVEISIVICLHWTLAGCMLYSSMS